MKLAAIAKLIKADGYCKLYKVFYDDCRTYDLYIGTKTAIFPLTGFPKAQNESELATLLGISKKEWADIEFDNDCPDDLHHIEGMDLDDTADGEMDCVTGRIGMSRPVAEAVQAACEWYLRLHMGQFWDLAEDLCFAKFYSDAENNAFQSEEQRKNAFNVAIGRRNTMLLEMERLYSRCVLPAPTSDVMKVPYRAEQVWLAIRHALAWHDKPEGDPWNVCFDKPLNRSDQPQPVVKLNEKQEAKK